MLKVDKKENIYRPNGTVMGTPKKNGNIYRSANRTGRIDLETGKVYNLKDEEIGEVDINLFSIFKTIAKPVNKEVKTKKTKVFETSKKTKKGETKTEQIKEDTEDEPKGKNIKEKLEAVRKKNSEEYRPGLDSEFLVSGEFAKKYYNNTSFRTMEQRALDEINLKHKWKHNDWEELSAKEDLSDAELAKYEDYVSWWDFLKCHPDREFDEKHRKKFAHHLMLRSLHLVPYNGTLDVMKSEDAEPIKVKKTKKQK